MVEHILLAVGIAGLLVVVTTGVAAVLVVRAVRRRWRAGRERLRGFLGPQVRDRTAPPVPSANVATVTSPGWWVVQNRRHRLWRAVSSAEQSVALARRADVAVGDLPALVERLRTAATGVDAVLRASAAAGTLRADDRADCDRIEAAAADIHAAALSSLRHASRVDTEPVVSAVRIEVAALAAGVRAAHR